MDGISRSGVIALSDEGGAQDLKVSEPPIDVFQPRREQSVHMGAGCFAAIADLDHLADLGKGQAGDWSAADEVHRDRASGP